MRGVMMVAVVVVYLQYIAPWYSCRLIFITGSTSTPSQVAYQLCTGQVVGVFPSPTMQPRYVCPEEEIARGPACWLWDYLRCEGLVLLFFFLFA